MHFQTVAKILGILLLMFSVTHLTPVLVSLIYSEGNELPFLISFSLTLITGLLLWLPTRRTKQDLRYRDGFLVVVQSFFVLSAECLRKAQ